MRRQVVAAVLAGVVGLTTTAAGRPDRSAVEIPAADRAVSFTVDGTVAYGTVHVPAHRPGRRLPAALLLPGSGPTDRNGDQPPTLTPHTLALIAGVLGDQGVLTLRFDKYFAGETGGGAYATDPGRIDLAAFIRQADAGYRLMARQTETDPAKLMVVGHSEGGLTGMLVANSVRPRPVGLALLEPQDLRLLDLVDLQLGEQLDAAVAAGQLSQQVSAGNKAGISAVIAEFRAGRPTDTSALLPGIAALFDQSLFTAANSNYVRTEDALYPPSVAAEVARGTTVLVTGGTEDSNVPSATLGPLVSALHRAGTRGPGLVVLPGLDHYLHPAGTPANDQVLAPSAVAALRSFANRVTR